MPDKVMLMGRADVNPEFVPKWAVKFVDPIHDTSLIREGAHAYPEEASIYVFIDEDGALCVALEYDPAKAEEGNIRFRVNGDPLCETNIVTGEHRVMPPSP